MPKVSRQVTISGQNGYVALDEGEKAAYEVRFYFSDLTTQAYQAENVKWFPARKFFGRVAFAQEEYVIEEKLINFNNELLGRFYSPSFQLLHELQCMHIESQYLALDAYQSLVAYAQSIALDLPISLPIVNTAAVISFARAITLQNAQPAHLYDLGLGGPDYVAYKQRLTPRMPIDGFYYSMEGLASGALTIQSWQFEEACPFPNGVASTRDNQGRPPSSAGGPDEPGRPGSVPPPSNNSKPPVPGDQKGPSTADPNPLPPPSKPSSQPVNTEAGKRYLVRSEYTQYGFTNVGERALWGPITPWITIDVGSVGGREASWYAGAGPAGGRDRIQQVSWNKENTNSIPTGFKVTIVRTL
jgi:hypothetical protein